MKLPTIENPLKLFTPPQPSLGTIGAAGNGMMFSSGSGSGSGGGFDDDDYGYDDDYDYDQPPAGDDEEPKAEPRPRSNRTRKAAATRSSTAGASRTRPAGAGEERYWTDYLRIALPVIGIILMVGLLWVWAANLLDNEVPGGDSTPDDQLSLVATETVDPNADTENAGQVSTPSAPNTTGNQGTGEDSTGTGTDLGEIPISGQSTAAPDTAAQPTAPADTGGDNTATTDDEPAEDEAPAGELTDGASVSVTEGEVNIRSSAGTSAEIVRTSEQGETGVILSGPEEADGLTWWQVVFDGPGDTGWVAEEFLEPVD